MPQERPSPQPLAVSLDVGGTSLASGVVHGDGSVSDRREGPIDAGASSQTIVRRLADDVQDRLGTAGAALPITIGFPGPFDYGPGIPRLEHKYRSIHGLDLGAALSAAVSLPHGPIRFCNDAAAAGTGEAWAVGADRGRVWVLLFGTGLGSALVDDGRFVARERGLDTTELWRTPLPDGRSCADDWFSATGLARALGVPAVDLPVVLRPDPLPGAVRGALDDWTDRLIEFCAGVLAEHPADRLVIGGGVARSLGHFSERLTAGVGLPVGRAHGGPDVALVGAALACGLTLTG